ncbi:hypothetical protein DRO02_02050 [archaeon]|nr:MAG: hypothetical protein DRO21_03270 [archaeon]RLG65462.1 MAG: hypothetical protein DRO02_02050 [archaeon]HDM24030.1 hypothetical protein [Candidatus Bathyarchaeota archaeon]
MNRRLLTEYILLIIGVTLLFSAYYISDAAVKVIESSGSVTVKPGSSIVVMNVTFTNEGSLEISILTEENAKVTLIILDQENYDRYIAGADYESILEIDNIDFTDISVPLSETTVIVVIDNIKSIGSERTKSLSFSLKAIVENQLLTNVAKAMAIIGFTVVFISSLDFISKRGVR